MCRITLHRMKCGHPVVKFHAPCHLSFPDAKGITSCYNKALARPVEVEFFTYGPGICAAVDCRERHGILPHDYTGDGQPYTPDHEPFDMSPAARIEGERRWREQKTSEQLREIDSRCKEANDFRRGIVAPYMPTGVINHSRLQALEAIHLARYYKANGVFPDTHVPEWWALNPRYMTAWELYQYVPLFLDIHVANPGAELRGPPAQHPDLVALIEDQEDAELYDCLFGSAGEHDQKDDGGASSQASSVTLSGISLASSATMADDDGGIDRGDVETNHDVLAEELVVEDNDSVERRGAMDEER